MRSICTFVFLTATLLAQPIVSASFENMRLASSTVFPAGSAWSVTLVMAPDNGSGSLPSSWRRWWHCQIGNLAPAGETLQIQVTNAGYSDIILPVWALSTDGGVSFGAWTRVPLTAVPSYSSGTHSFTLQTPPGVTTIRLAKYFPYTVSDSNDYLNAIAGHPSGHVRSISNIGFSQLGRPIEMIEITDTGVPDAGKRRVWIHSGIHPAENTSYFMVEGLVDFLLSGDLRAETILDQVIFDIVPMANPDGVFRGNYRTNANSVNLEAQWAAPYNSSQPEIIALRSQIESFMGTATSPGANPIEVVLNLHSTHNITWPFHFRHVANSSFDLATNRSGVIPQVNALETQWINAFEARSPLTNLGSTASSTCSSPSRPFVECMMHDRWSIDSAWTGPPNLQSRVMAITYEGTYGLGVGGGWHDTQEYRTVGRDMGLALGDYLGILPNVAINSFGPPCAGAPILIGNLNVGATSSSLTLQVFNAPVVPDAFLVASTQRIFSPLPPFGCQLLLFPDVLIPMSVNASGQSSLAVQIPNSLSLAIDVQFVASQLFLGNLQFFASNGLELSAIL